MNIKLLVGALVILGIVGVIVATVLNGTNSGSDNVDQVEEFVVTRPAVKPVPNTFSVMTPEESAAADEAERLAAEAALLASSTASSTATSTASTTEEVEG